MIKKRFCAMALIATMTLSLTPVFGAEIPMAPTSVLVTHDGSFLIADAYNNAIWKQALGKTPSRVAGRVGVLDVNGDPIGGYHDGTALEAAFTSPWGMTKYKIGYAISDTQNHVIRYLVDDKVSTIAGSITPGATNALGTKASFSHPTGLAYDPSIGDLYVADTGNSLIRKIDRKGNVTTFAGSTEGCSDGSLTTAKFSEPTALFFNAGVLYVADSGNHRICKIENNEVKTIAGSLTGEADLIDGKAMDARFEAPQGLLVKGNTIYIADTGNGAVRMLKDGEVSTLLSMGALAQGLYPVSPRGLALAGDTLYVGDIFARTLIPIALTEETKSSKTFSDVPSDAWFAQGVNSVSDKNFMLGTSDSLFSPQASTTRGMAVTVLFRMEEALNLNAPAMGNHSFDDVPRNMYFAKPIGWASTNNIVSGVTKTEFMPEKPLTRGELVTFFYRYASYKDYASLEKKADLTAFSDYEALPTYTTDAFAWACSTGLVVGNTEKELNPNTNVTRAEFAVMVDRFLQLQ